MSTEPQHDLLNTLRDNLRHIEDEHRDEDLTPAACEMKALLLRRIANIEAAMKNLNEIIQRSSGQESHRRFRPFTRKRI